MDNLGNFKAVSFSLETIFISQHRRKIYTTTKFYIRNHQEPIMPYVDIKHNIIFNWGLYSATKVFTIKNNI